MIKKSEKTSLDKVMIIIGYVAIGIAAYFLIGFLFPSSYEYDNRIGDTDGNNQKMIKIHIELLEEEGYEVLYFGYLGLNYSDETAYIKMKTLGNRNEQVWSSLSSLGLVYPDAPEYTIRILEEKQECWYRIEGELYRDYRNYGTGYGKSVEEFIESDTFKLYDQILPQIENPTSCSWE